MTKNFNFTRTDDPEIMELRKQFVMMEEEFYHNIEALFTGARKALELSVKKMLLVFAENCDTENIACRNNDAKTCIKTIKTRKVNNNNLENMIAYVFDLGILDNRVRFHTFCIRKTGNTTIHKTINHSVMQILAILVVKYCFDTLKAVQKCASVKICMGMNDKRFSIDFAIKFLAAEIGKRIKNSGTFSGDVKSAFDSLLLLMENQIKANGNFFDEGLLENIKSFLYDNDNGCVEQIREGVSESAKRMFLTSGSPENINKIRTFFHEKEVGVLFNLLGCFLELQGKIWVPSVESSAEMYAETAYHISSLFGNKYAKYNTGRLYETRFSQSNSPDDLNVALENYMDAAKFHISEAKLALSHLAEQGLCIGCKENISPLENYLNVSNHEKKWEIKILADECLEFLDQTARQRLARSHKEV